MPTKFYVGVISGKRLVLAGDLKHNMQFSGLAAQSVVS